jgi:hypothetical protein
MLGTLSWQVSLTSNGFKPSTIQFLVLFYVASDNLLSNLITKALESRLLLMFYHIKTSLVNFIYVAFNECFCSKDVKARKKMMFSNEQIQKKKTCK